MFVLYILASALMVDYAMHEGYIWLIVAGWWYIIISVACLVLYRRNARAFHR